MFCINKNPDGKIDGCCLYRIHQKWDGGIHQSQMQIISFLYTNQDAAKSLWSFLSGSGMIRSISMPHARIDEPLRWMLKDGRSLQQEEVQDHIWLRVMDPVEVLRNRGFQGLTKEFSIAVNDSTGITESVTLKIQPKGSFAEVHITDEQPDIEMDIGTLSSLVLGGNSVWTFAEAGRFKLHSEDALNNAACAFSAGPVPFCDNSY
jgi:predicted acetyltransferase